MHTLIQNRLLRGLRRGLLGTAATLAIVLGLNNSALASPVVYSNILVFGDSLSDVGNTSSVLGPLAGGLGGYGNNGRFSNGPLWHEQLATELGLPGSTNQASRIGGDNYAHGGAEIDNATGFSAGLLAQKNDYLNGRGAAGSDPNALYIAWGGGNDMRAAARSTNPQSLIDAGIASLEGMIRELLDNGVNNLLIPNLPDLGRIPEFRTSANSANATNATVGWNNRLLDMLLDVAGTTTASIFYFDVFSVFNDVLANPGSYGFTNTTGQCRSLFLGLFERSCNNPSTFVFWDAIHPTTAAHSALGLAAFDLLASGARLPNLSDVPEPSVLLLIALGLLLLSYRRRTALQPRSAPTSMSIAA